MWRIIWSLSKYLIYPVPTLLLLVMMPDDKMPNLFLNLCNHPWLAVNGLVSVVWGDGLLKSSQRLIAFWCSVLPPTEHITHKLNAFPTLTKHLSHTVILTFALWASTAKPAWFCFLHNFTDRRFILIIGLSDLSMQLFPFLIKLRTFTYPLKGSTFWLLLGISELPASLLLSFGPLLSKIRKTWTQALLLGTVLPGFRSCNPPWLRLSQRPWDHKLLRRQSLSPWQGCCLCPLYFTLLGPEPDQLANDR